MQEHGERQSGHVVGEREIAREGERGPREIVMRQSKCFCRIVLEYETFECVTCATSRPVVVMLS